MDKAIEFNQSYKGIFTLNNRTWNIINDFFEDAYSKFFISIELENGDKLGFDNFDDALKGINEHTHGITSLHITGVNESNDDSGKITCHSHYIYTKPSVFVEIAYQKDDYKKIDVLTTMLYTNTKAPLKYERGLSFVYIVALSRIILSGLYSFIDSLGIVLLIGTGIIATLFLLGYKLIAPLVSRLKKTPTLKFVFSVADKKYYRKLTAPHTIFQIVTALVGVGLLVLAFTLFG